METAPSSSLGQFPSFLDQWDNFKNPEQSVTNGSVKLSWYKGTTAYGTPECIYIVTLDRAGRIKHFDMMGACVYNPTGPYQNQISEDAKN